MGFHSIVRSSSDRIKGLTGRVRLDLRKAAAQGQIGKAYAYGSVWTKRTATE